MLFSRNQKNIESFTIMIMRLQSPPPKRTVQMEINVIDFKEYLVNSILIVSSIPQQSSFYEHEDHSMSGNKLINVISSIDQERNPSIHLKTHQNYLTELNTHLEETFKNTLIEYYFFSMIIINFDKIVANIMPNSKTLETFLVM